MRDSPLRVALVADLLSEQWPSMDLVADMLLAELGELGTRANLRTELIRPTLRRRNGSFGRYRNRFVDYTWWLRQHLRAADVFHVVDHSYAHLVHVLPADRTVVTCHDPDAFLRLVAPERNTSRLPKTLTRTVLSGMRKAAHVTCDSQVTHDEILRFGLMPSDRLSIVHMGVHPVFRLEPDRSADAELTTVLGPKNSEVTELLHVGTCIPRKRIDVLLNVLAAIATTEPRVRLLKAGGQLTGEQRDLAARLGVERRVVQLPHVHTAMLAALYRRADVTVLPSDREGFGLPLVESLACGTPVVASDIPVFREVGGPAVDYAPVGDALQWRDRVLQTLCGEREEPGPALRRANRVRHASRFSWRACAESMCALYEDIGGRATSPASLALEKH